MKKQKDKNLEKQFKEKSDEIFYRVFRKKEFKKDLEKARNELGIPTNGCSSEANVKKWWNNMTGSVAVKYDDLIGKILRKHNLPISFWKHFENALLMNKYSASDYQNTVCTCTTRKESEMKRFFLIASPFAKYEDIHSYVKENKEEIKELLESIRGDFPKTLHKLKNKDRDEFIYELSKKDWKTLHPLPEEKYKENTISRIVQENYGSKRLGLETIRTIIRKQKQMEKG